jgi:multimeric flavodoxin WrbA
MIMTLKVIAFNGSPRKDGNTSILLQTVLKELEANNIQTEEIHVGAKQIQGCIACYKCLENKNRQCVLKNDPVNEWIDKMYKADGILIGSPTYFADLSGQIKSFLDRAFFVANANDGMFQRKLGAGIVAVRRAGSVHTFHSLNAYFTISQMIIVGSSYWNMGFGMEKGDVLQDAEGLQTMRDLGRNMAWLLKSLEGAKRSI